MIATGKDGEVSALQNLEALIAGASGQIEHVGAAFVGRTVAGGAGAGNDLGAAQIAIVGNGVAEIDQCFNETGDAQGFRTHAGAAHGGPGGGRNAKEVDLPLGVERVGHGNAFVLDQTLLERANMTFAMRCR